MDELDSKLGAILGNPEMMAQIQALAQKMGQPTSKNESEAKQSEPSGFPDMDLSMIKRLSALAGQSSIDKNQRTLLNALQPYLSQGRISKLERAMRAAKMAAMAGVLTNTKSPGR